MTELTLIINKKWPIGSIEQLLRLLNLSKLQILRLHFNSECDFIVTLTIEVCKLVNQAKKIRSIEINCNYLVKTMSETIYAVCLKLPNYIRRLEIDIADADDGKLILEQAEHLSSITFRPYKGSYSNREIIESISKMGNHAKYKLQPDLLDERADPEDDCTIHVWLSRNMTKQSNVSAKAETGKRCRSCLQS